MEMEVGGTGRRLGKLETEATMPKSRYENVHLSFTSKRLSPTTS